PANLGLADQQAALNWVRDNATAFGGNPGNVTLMGESSGGFTSCANLTSPSAEGLFDKVILESAPCLNPEGVTLDQAREEGAELAAELDCDSVECRRDKPVADVLEAYGQRPTAELIVGDEILPEPVPESIESGDFH